MTYITAIVPARAQEYDILDPEYIIEHFWQRPDLAFGNCLKILRNFRLNLLDEPATASCVKGF